MPLVMPPTVIGFFCCYCSARTASWVSSVHFEYSTLAFRSGLVIASMLYSLPFMVQPWLTPLPALIFAYARLRPAWAQTRRHIRNLVLPLSKRGFISACVLTFAHTIGEFGIVLMVGGNIPGETRVISIAIYASRDSQLRRSLYFVWWFDCTVIHRVVHGLLKQRPIVPRPN